MSKGYLILAQNSKQDDYVRLAYALAMSIKGTQSTVSNVAIATNNAVPSSYSYAFDHIVDIPWNDQASISKWKIENKWKYYYMTPFDETVVLDADMLFPSDISYWWDTLQQKDIWITDKPRTFKGEVITSTEYRPAFASNNLPNVYTAFMYFKKTDLVHELFKMTQLIFENWERFFYDFMDETRPKHLSGDVAYALAIKILGIEDECFDIDSIPTFVHMKPYVQNVDKKLLSDNWTKNIPTYFDDDCRFKIGNYEQYLPFHYQVKEWLTDDMILKLERKLGA
jgi:hypothetical protein